MPAVAVIGLPRYIDGSRTLKGDGNFPYVAERRGVSFIERSLKQGLQFARHKNNTEGLLTRPLLYLSLFLKMHRQEYYRRLRAVREAGDWEGGVRVLP